MLPVCDESEFNFTPWACMEYQSLGVNGDIEFLFGLLVVKVTTGS